MGTSSAPMDFRHSACTWTILSEGGFPCTWRYLRIIWMESCLMCSGMTLFEQGGWTRQPAVAPSNLTHPVVLTFCIQVEQGGVLGPQTCPPRQISAFNVRWHKPVDQIPLCCACHHESTVPFPHKLYPMGSCWRQQFLSWAPFQVPWRCKGKMSLIAHILPKQSPGSSFHLTTFLNVCQALLIR